ncbi:MAG: response regulator transcription factor [Candidatus Gracilibacteria bacterium]|nr:response regulator transcription factor [Candidatus Gracilibacteria bacterium]
MKILIIEDHPKIRENISKFLKISGYLSETAINGFEALEKVKHNHYDVIILDINMPIMDGREFMKNIKKLEIKIPIIALTSNSMLDDKVEMFDLGVDDYLTKPFELKELELRIKAVGKRKNMEIQELITIGNIEINLSKHKIFSKEVEIELSNKEYLIIEFLSINKGFPKSKIQILEHVWGEQEENLNLSSVTLEAHISVIRKKIGKDFIKTIKGVGYIIE